jgi:hypothetical protein
MCPHANFPQQSRQKLLIVEAINARWVLSGGLEVNPWLRRDLKDLPPDRTMLGRAYWTMLHAFSVYMPNRPSGEQLAAFRYFFFEKKNSSGEQLEDF